MKSVKLQRISGAFVHVFQRKSLKPQNKYKLLPYVMCIIPLYLRWQNCIVCFQSGSSQNIELRIFFYESADLHLWYEKDYKKIYQFRNCFFKTSSVKHSYVDIGQQSGKLCVTRKCTMENMRSSHLLKVVISWYITCKR